MPDYFPLDVAFTDAFFDRVKERIRLKENLMTNTHTLITSPRRYGKTSLVLKTLSELEQIVSISLDMMVASDEDRIKQIILEGIGKVTTTLSSGKAKILDLIRKVFQPFTMVDVIQFGQLSIHFHAHFSKAPYLIVLDALQRLEELLAALDRKVVIFFDEYQYIFSIKNIIEFESVLRSFAQISKHVICIFSGSNRHKLQAIFSDSARPFYNMCDHILLERISAKDYTDQLKDLSQKTWNQSLNDTTIQVILDTTCCHSYYVNALCRRLWHSKTLPDATKVLLEWQELATEKRYEINNDFDNLTALQRTILIESAREPFIHPTSKEVFKRLNGSLSGITHAIELLIERDYIFQDKHGYYRVLNPLMEYVLRQEVNKFL